MVCGSRSFVQRGGNTQYSLFFPFICNVFHTAICKVEDALLARDQARALEIQSRRELARVLEARKVRGGRPNEVRTNLLCAETGLFSNLGSMVVFGGEDSKVTEG